MTLPRTFVLTVRRHIKRFEDTAKHLDEIGIKWEPFLGVDNQIMRLNAKDPFDVDRAGERLEAKHVAATLTHYLLWQTMKYQPDESFVALEFDVRFVDGWQQQFDEAMEVLPDDWDIVYLGSCCCKGRESYQVMKWNIPTNLWDVRYPLCGHAIMYRKKCLETLLTVHQKIDMPLDISMYHQKPSITEGLHDPSIHNHSAQYFPATMNDIELLKVLEYLSLLVSEIQCRPFGLPEENDVNGRQRKLIIDFSIKLIERYATCM